MINGEEVGEVLSDCNRAALRVILTFRALGPPPVKDGQGPVVPPDEPDWDSPISHVCLALPL